MINLLILLLLLVLTFCFCMYRRLFLASCRWGREQGGAGQPVYINHQRRDILCSSWPRKVKISPRELSLQQQNSSYEFSRYFARSRSIFRDGEIGNGLLAHHRQAQLTRREDLAASNRGECCLYSCFLTIIIEILSKQLSVSAPIIGSVFRRVPLPQSSSYARLLLSTLTPRQRYAQCQLNYWNTECPEARCFLLLRYIIFSLNR